MKPTSFALFGVSAAIALALASCALPGSGSSSDDLVKDLSLSQSTYLVVDLATGTTTGFSELPDLTTNVAYRSTSMVFHQVDGGGTTLGASAGTLGAGVDPAATSVNIPRFYCGVFEVTQAQWQVLAGTTPWTSVSILSGGITYTLTPTADQPAYGLSRMMVDVAVQAHNAGKNYSLALPTNPQWERACRGGTATPFFWGSDASNRTAAVSFAQINETRGSTLGPSAVGQRQANPFGLYDMQGNVWELTRTGPDTSLRGGSWYDPMSVGRSSNIVPIDRGTPHVLAGVRLVLIP